MANLKITDNLTIGKELRVGGGIYINDVNIFDVLYPINHAVIKMDDADYSNWLGLKWERVAAGYALWTASSGAGGTIAAGLPNITGNINPCARSDYSSASGAFTMIKESGWYPQGSTSERAVFTFDASKSNSIYGKSTTVQPPAIKICMWMRTD